MQGPEDRLPSLGPPGILPPRDQDRGPGGKSCTSLQRTSRAAPRPRRVRGGPGTPSPPSPRPVQTPERRGAWVFSGGEGGAAGAGAQPPYHLHLAGVELAGGRGHGELDLLAVLGVHGGRVVGGRGARRGVRGCGPGALLRAPRRQRAECGGEEQEGCSRTDKNTAPARGGGAGAGGGRLLAYPAGLRGSPVPRCLRARTPGSPARGSGSLSLPSFPRSLSVSLRPSSISLAPSPHVCLCLCLCLAPSLRVSPSGPSLGVPSPSPQPGTGARELGGRTQETGANERRGACSPGAWRRAGSVSQDAGSGLGAPRRLPRT